eukprot:gene17716-24075_t
MQETGVCIFCDALHAGGYCHSVELRRERKRAQTNYPSLASTFFYPVRAVRLSLCQSTSPFAPLSWLTRLNADPKRWRDELWELCSAFCIFCDALHAGGYCHADVKLQNMLVIRHADRAAVYYVSNFGLAASAASTVRQSMVGTPLFCCGMFHKAKDFQNRSGRTCVSVKRAWWHRCVEEGMANKIEWLAQANIDARAEMFRAVDLHAMGHSLMYLSDEMKDGSARKLVESVGRCFMVTMSSSLKQKTAMSVLNDVHRKLYDGTSMHGTVVLDDGLPKIACQVPRPLPKPTVVAGKVIARLCLQPPPPPAPVRRRLLPPPAPKPRPGARAGVARAAAFNRHAKKWIGGAVDRDAGLPSPVAMRAAMIVAHQIRASAADGVNEDGVEDVTANGTEDIAGISEQERFYIPYRVDA